jgi:large subunit ribosomal protein L18
MLKKHALRTKRHTKIRSRILGTIERPRLSVYRGLRHLYVQFIDDMTGTTILGASDKAFTGTGIERAKQLGDELAMRAKAKKISAVSFDRGGFKYHGQIKALADAMRDGGVTI